MKWRTRIAQRSWWFLLGVTFAPYITLVVLLECGWLLRLDEELDLLTWYRLACLISVASGILCIWRTPLHWFLRLDFSVLYFLFVGYSLLILADRHFEERFGG